MTKLFAERACIFPIVCRSIIFRKLMPSKVCQYANRAQLNMKIQLIDLCQCQSAEARVVIKNRMNCMNTFSEPFR